MKARHIRVQRTARYYVLGAPGPQTRELWVACHGYGQLAEPFAAKLDVISTDDRAVVVPEALSRFYIDEPARRHGPETPVGAGWMTREDREAEIRDYVEYLDAVTATVRENLSDDVRTIAFGFSQGVATACRWAALGKWPAARLVLWGGPLPQDLAWDRGAALFRNAPVTFVAGTRDTVVTPAAARLECDRLRAAGIEVDFVEFDGAHLLDSATLRGLVSPGA